MFACQIYKLKIPQCYTNLILIFETLYKLELSWQLLISGVGGILCSFVTYTIMTLCHYMNYSAPHVLVLCSSMYISAVSGLLS